MSSILSNIRKDTEQTNNATNMNTESQTLEKQYPVGNQYIIEKQLGNGSYGTVAQAAHVASGKKVAIKKIKGAFSSKKQAKRVLREVFILKYMPRHPNIVKLLEVIEPSNNIMDCNDMYLVF